jgi:predicted chitinase
VLAIWATQCLLQAVPPRYHSRHEVRRPSTGWGDTNVADNGKRWQDMNPDEQAVVIRQINGAVNGLQFRVQDLEDAVKALQERLKR